METPVRVNLEELFNVTLAGDNRSNKKSVVINMMVEVSELVTLVARPTFWATFRRSGYQPDKFCRLPIKLITSDSIKKASIAGEVTQQ
ncbi:MAG: hypothetical protein KBG20_11530 [Caldilineaceae bacterium]|nr:hypothetical protein [Caldilineaceae bacterium]MBP8122760.1 hypothetical protein [Caldilineaceae bacterium]MBP9072928.1 hypothetical protein [Caldilineaceae bacterium]